ncbi:MAG: NRDE family protein [Halopseudomonas sp.]
MCLLAFAWQVGGQPLTLLGNRDEFHARPTRAADFWSAEGQPDLLAGKDLQAGGTWLGVTRRSRFATLTNIRAPGVRQGALSRGALVLDYLRSNDPPGQYLQALADQQADFSPFNLLVGNPQELWLYNSEERQPLRLQPGIYALSNGQLQSNWPKQLTLRERLAANLQAAPDALLALLEDTHVYADELLPQTGVNLEWERMLSAAFIVSQDYGTRSSSLLSISGQEDIHFVERRFGRNGKLLGESGWDLLPRRG